MVQLITWLSRGAFILPIKSAFLRYIECRFVSFGYPKESDVILSAYLLCSKSTPFSGNTGDHPECARARALNWVHENISFAIMMIMMMNTLTLSHSFHFWCYITHLVEILSLLHHPISPMKKANTIGQTSQYVSSVTFQLNNKAGYTARTSRGRVGRGDYARFHT